MQMQQIHRTRPTLPDPAPVRTGVVGTLGSIWADRRAGLILAAALPAGLALANAWTTPRGPVTTGEALAAMAAGVLVGVTVGLLSANRWSLLVAPVVFVAVFELARAGTAGITVGAVHLGSLYGWIAFVLGRAIPMLLVLAPMVLGCHYGILLARRLGNEAVPALHTAGWILTGLASVALLGLAVLIARPADTAPILDAGGDPLPRSVAELVTAPIGGHDQVMMIRGRDVTNPVLLYLAGGPGGTDIGAMRRDTALEADFVVVTWDQRGAGKSYTALDPTDTFTLDGMVSDTLEVTEWLRARFGQEKVYLVGQSWGSTLAVLAAQRRPDLYHAVVGVGQMVSQRETDVMFWEDTVTWAEEGGDTGLAGALRANGPPPYADVTRYEPIVAHEHDWNPYPGFDAGNEMPAILFVPEMTFMDRVNAFRGFLDTATVLYPQLQDIDFRHDVPELLVPYTMVLGEHEARGRAVLAEEWYRTVDAPHKERVVLEGAGHRANFDRPAQFSALMRRMLEGVAT